MKAIPIFLLAGAAIIAGCQQPANHSSTSITHPGDSASAAHTVPTNTGLQCFMKVVGRDSVILQFQVRHDSVSGHLAYRNYEKDKSAGNIKGSLRDSIIDVQYHFMSEGMESTVQTLFKLEDGKAYAGLPGDFDKEGRPVFDKDPARIQFDTVPFLRVPCL
ncbi:hypothetical protein [Chitinophaga japonensis]|uniref:Lipoprotein n=1 Tax=Chitinophaga japonensis TaxID=104662 RepID=A0A562TE50_CHIJA|nr:hypothetical protein [Chitinophaga japonensis]TWI91366.1 hypothetical protein LX66_0735 [Chitinophaga japonensis]